MRSHLSGLYQQAGLYWMTMALLVGAVLAGCQAPRQTLQQLANEQGRTLEILSVQPYPLALVSPRKIPTGSRLRVYLEGDGHAWITSKQPSLDPSPRNLLVTRLATGDPYPSVYLARPCQFVSTLVCKPELWTNRRFSQEIVDSLGQALNQLKTRYRNQEFELVGYSGGAALALLLAAQRDDVSFVQTIAGNLSPRLWAQMKGLSPLSGSLDPLDYRTRLQHLPQRHMIGEQDRVVPARLAELYQQARGGPACSQIVRITDANHDSGWETSAILWTLSQPEPACPSPTHNPKPSSSVIGATRP
ncbi:alpha/beta hydrolase [Pseudomonas aeruginosa]|uniref:alpha/beta hydrolase n=1 Tax=Pseudomonas aeruginosa TaxID=287 RepID=UPI002904C1D8|nr:alpha/beta hydrolase [Pseudomonas aeruginosa]MDU0538064.1 alpha/beta hydrolase [Pseudomonas aeruginosa]